MTASRALDRIADWQTALRAENKSPGTICLYADGATRYLRWCADGNLLPMSRAVLNSWIAGLLDGGSSPGTARIRQLAVRRFASWLTAGGEIHADPFPGVKAPRYEPPLVEPLTDGELRALLATCAVHDDRAGKGARPEDTLNDRRDEAIIRIMFETAIRSGELVDLQLDDLDLIGRLATIRRGKGGRPQPCPAPPRQACRSPGLQAAPATPHRRPSLAGRRRLRIRPHGHRRLDALRHARPLHPRRRLRARRRRSPSAQPGRPLTRVVPIAQSAVAQRAEDARHESYNMEPRSDPTVG